MSTSKKYSRIFDSKSQNWDSNGKNNLVFLKHTETYLNDLLKVRGYVFLRDVYDALGIGPITKESIVCGWRYDKAVKLGHQHIEFNIKKIGDQIFKIDFNVDGNILDYFDEEQDE